MESNNLNLGHDMEDETPMSETEQTTAGEQAQPETPVESTTPELEDVQTEAQPEAAAAETPADEAPEDADSPDEVADAPEVEDVAAAAVAVAATDDAAQEEESEDGEAEAEDEDDDSEYEGASDYDYDEDDEEDEDEAEAEEEDEARIRRGDIVTGTVLETSPTEVLVDLGDDATGVIANRELERMDRAAIEALQPGSEVTAFVLKVSGATGQPVLSLARAEEERNWRLAQEHYESKSVYFSKIAGYNKGGLIVRFGKVRGFVPASQISRERQQRASGGSPEERWGGMVGEDIAVKVVEIDRGRNRLILSERAAAREWRERQKSRLLQELEVGEFRKGRVISLADFGAFVDLGGADGLVHLTELSWQHVTHPREVVDVGQEVEVEVISIDPDRKRIGLSMKRMQEDPWMAVVKQYDVGQLVQATVTKLTKFGAFARLVDAPEIEGLIHISELADYRVSHPREVVLVGDVLTLRIVKIDAERRRLGLSLRQVDSAKFMDQDWQFLDDDIE